MSVKRIEVPVMPHLHWLAGLFLALATAGIGVPAVSAEDEPVPVTVENFIRAESDLYFSAVALKEGGFGKFEHEREVTPIDDQNVIRQNRDTLYSAAVFDLDAGPVTVQTAGCRRSLHVDAAHHRGPIYSSCDLRL